MVSLIILPILLVASAVNAGFNDGFGFGPSQSFTNSRVSQFDNRFSNAGGNAASAGTAGALAGHATSINTANHEASRGRTQSNALSANTADGFNPIASGSAIASGNVNSGVQRGSMFENQSGFLNFRRKRQAFPSWFGPNSGANANSLGGGSVGFGSINVNNFAHTSSNPWGASGIASGNANGVGSNLNLWNAASSNSFSNGRKRRQAGWGLPLYSFQSPSYANANSLGGASTLYGNAFTNNLATSNTGLWNANSAATGNAGASGINANAWNAAISNSQTGR